MRNTFGTLLISLIFLTSTGAQTLEVWPGDANNNGVVNNIDLLQIGLGYNYFGPERDSTYVGWAGQQAPPWPLVLGNGLNAAYADADGNGLVNYFYDAFPIYVHYGLEHGTPTADPFPVGTAGVDPPLYFNAVPPQVHGGSSISLPLALGTAALPVEDLYGLAFSIHVDPDFVKVEDVQVNFNQVSWANPDNDRITSSYRASNSKLDVAWVRTDHNERSGFGDMGTVSIVIIDDVISLDQDFQLRIDSIHLIDRFGNLTAIAGDTVTIELLADEVTAAPGVWGAPLRVWPNPAKDILHLRAAEPIRQAVLVDVLGRQAYRLTPESPAADWPLAGVPPGLYWLEVTTDRQTYRMKISHE